MANSILAFALLAGGDDPASAPPVSNPLVGIPYNLDLAWGAGATDAPAVLSTTLTCPGSVIDTTYGPAIRGHGVALGGRRGIDLGWTPNGKAVFLTAQDAALGLWRLQFPAAGIYTLMLAGVGTRSITAIGSAPTVTSPMVKVLHPAPLNRQPSKLLRLTFIGLYPAGGLDLLPTQIGLAGILFADLNDDATYRYTWNENRLRAWTGSSEATGMVNLTTVGLFFGTVG